jgi:RNA polymerase sigma factor (sigma-70 family)
MTVTSDTKKARTWFEDEILELLPDLLSLARSMADTASDAEDLVAEAVSRAWERLDQLRSRKRFRGWLFQILRNCCLARRREQGSRPATIPLPEEDGQEPSFSLFDRLHQPFLMWWGSAEEEFLDGLLKEDLQAAVRGLPEEYRTVVLLVDVHGLKYREAADTLGVPVGTVRSRLARARARLQEELWSHAVDHGLREPRSDHEEKRT